MLRAGKIVAGFGLIAVGVPMLILPGPGIITILAGLGLVAQEVEWARRLSDRVYRRNS